VHDSASLLHQIAETVARHIPTDGERSTSVPGLYISRKSVPSAPLFGVQWPCFALVAQGAKSLLLGAETYRYGVGDYLVVSADLPVSSSVTTASRRQPNLGIGLALDAERLGPLLERIDAQRIVGATPGPRGVSVQRAPVELLDATLRLLRLLDHPADTAALSPLLQEEISYRLLQGPCGEQVRHLIASRGRDGKVHAAARWLRDHFTEPLQIERLARRCGMSASGLHHRFKGLTGMSPLQYQKQLRLQAARRALQVEGLDVTSAASRVGYASLSQFSREYSRQFGAPPRKDLQRR
jgi:AraC-like DNA-binding protein